MEKDASGVCVPSGEEHGTEQTTQREAHHATSAGRANDDAFGMIGAASTLH